MANVPDELMYTPEHEYVLLTDNPSIVQIGITDYAQGELGDVVYVDLPKVGSSFDRMSVFGTIEAVKAVSELFCPVAGSVVAINTALEADPAVVNRDPYGDGWMIRLRLKSPRDLETLLSPADYRNQIGQ